MSNFLNFNGRVNRGKYFLYLFVISCISGILSIVIDNTDSRAIHVSIIIVTIVLAAKYICVAIQRFHDIERPGTHFWLLLIPIYNIYLEIVLVFKKGTDGENKFGNDPLLVSNSKE